ncbi:type II toxin-antitoxin system RelE/ParE family toxin [Enterococcus sp. DIV0756]|uniref:type II toxin-antitoxin system RelE/ParE family toxin n=1 Tax=Enterococcus sp. DIV0756 TaxID=2774636 RepID=UPI003F2830AD
MGYDVILSPHVKKYLKKLKDKTLKQKFIDVIYDDIALNPYRFDQKNGDLKDLWTAKFRYFKSEYRIAYKIIDEKVIPILLIGTHENFYNQIKRLM